jgi:hypothetical protein
MNQFEFPTTRGVPAMRIGGNVYHNLGSIYPEASNQAKFMQCFFHTNEIRDDFWFFSENERAVHDTIMQSVREHNPFYLSLKAHLESNTKAPLFRLVISDIPPPDAASRTYNRPTSNEVAVIVTGAEEDSAAASSRVVIIQERGGGVQRIPSTHTSYDPLAYVITHMFADKGWTYDGIPKIKCDRYGKPEKSAQGDWLYTTKFVTATEYYAYRFHTRDDPKLNDILQDTLTYGGLLKQQFECDMYVKVEEQRLKFLQMQENQKTIKADTYSGLADAIHANEQSLAGKRIILPATFTGGPRYMYKNFQNAMAIVRKFGKPFLFITFTTNPQWREILENLRPGDKAHHRTDLIARVFRLKLKALLKDITDKDHAIFGKKVAHAMTVEFQKRGLPHAHILLILSESDRQVSEEQYDSYVCAEIPNPAHTPDCMPW